MNHFFDTEHAEEFGLAEAVVISNFQFWIVKNKANGSNLREGRTWTYNTVKALGLLFPYLTSAQIRGAIDRLVTKGVLVTGNYNTSKVDRTTWYAFRDENKFLPHLRNLANGLEDGDNSDLRNSANAIAAQRKTVTTDVNADGKPTNVNPDGEATAKPRKAAKKPPAGEKAEVRATRLPTTFVLPKSWGEWAQAKYPHWTAEYIREVGEKFRDHWCAVGGQRGTKTDWLGTWRNWCRNEGGMKPPAPAAGGPWYETESGIMAEGARLGMTPMPGELPRAFKDRIVAAKDPGNHKPARTPDQVAPTEAGAAPKKFKPGDIMKQVLGDKAAKKSPPQPPSD